MSNSLFWFRRDLRFEDNAGLFQALKNSMSVLPVFVFDVKILDQLEDKKDKRVNLIHQRLIEMDLHLRSLGSGMIVRYGNAVEVIFSLCREYGVTDIYCNEDYEPQAIQRDNEVASVASSKSIGFYVCKDQVVFAKDEVIKADGKPYTIFTPYSKRWKLLLYEKGVPCYESELMQSKFAKVRNSQLPSISEIGFEQADVHWSKPRITEHLFKEYADTRNIPSFEYGTSHLSVHLRFGVVSVRNLVRQAMDFSEPFLNELIWREFFMMILYHFPRVATQSFKASYEGIRWRNNETEFERWCTGNTGYPFVDAGMRELNATGLMHNRVRMVVASFLIKHLLVDWRWGELYFAQKLLDYDLSANNGNWQWAAGCGCDAAPYFRVFNPTEQLKRFDKDLEYTRRWVPELDDFAYPSAVVEHKLAYNRALAAYKDAIISSNI